MRRVTVLLSGTVTRCKKQAAITKDAVFFVFLSFFRFVSALFLPRQSFEFRASNLLLKFLCTKDDFIMYN